VLEPCDTVAELEGSRSGTPVEERRLAHAVSPVGLVTFLCDFVVMDHQRSGKF
jgi:hypothetical protein